MKRRTYVLWKRRITQVLIVVALFGSVYIMFRTRLFTVTKYDLQGIPQASIPTIESRLAEIASVPLYKVLPSNRIFSHRREAIRDLVVTTLPGTKSVAIVPTSLHTLRITVNSYTPLFKLDDNHAITKEGIIYEELDRTRKLPYLDVASSSIVTRKENDISIQTLVASTTIPYEKLATLIEKIDSVLYPVSKVSIDSYGDVGLYDDRGTSQIKLPLTSDMNKIWSNILSAIDTEPLKSKLVKEGDALEYLDARFGNKVFYKFTNTNSAAIIPDTYASSTATTTPR